MKRDPDLIRNLMINFEENLQFDGKGFTASELKINDYSQEVITYHIGLLIDAGYIEFIDFSSAGGKDWLVTSITWEGHNFIDAARNENAWNKVKQKMLRTGGFVLELAKPLLLDIIKQQLGL